LLRYFEPAESVGSRLRHGISFDPQQRYKSGVAKGWAATPPVQDRKASN
jgi:hypothetical protein